MTPNMYPKFFLHNFQRFYKRKFLHSMLCNFRVCVIKFSLLFFQSVLWWFHSVAVARVAAPRHHRRCRLPPAAPTTTLHSIEVSRRLLGWHSEQNFITKFFVHFVTFLIMAIFLLYLGQTQESSLKTRVVFSFRKKKLIFRLQIAIFKFCVAFYLKNTQIFQLFIRLPYRILVIVLRLN